MTQWLEAEEGDVVGWPAQGNAPAEAHVYEKSSVLAINAALAAKRPLLVRGEPGTGKSQLARAAACSLRWPLLTKVVDHRTTARDLLWTFDAVARLGKAQLLGALGRSQGQGQKSLEEQLAGELDDRNFLYPGPLWWALDWESAKNQANREVLKNRGKQPVTEVQYPEQELYEPQPLQGWERKKGTDERRPCDDRTTNKSTVVLIDEIDKADSDVPNGLLECLGQRTFTPPGYRQELCCMIKDMPLVIITTNEERALPDAFLRRCLVLHLELPRGREKLIDLLTIRGRAHFTEEQASDDILRRAARLLYDDREIARSQGLSAPGQAEYLDLVRAVVEREPDPRHQGKLLDLISQFALKKHPEVVAS